MQEESKIEIWGQLLGPSEGPGKVRFRSRTGFRQRFVVLFTFTFPAKVRMVFPHGMAVSVCSANGRGRYGVSYLDCVGVRVRSETVFTGKFTLPYPFSFSALGRTRISNAGRFGRRS